MNTLQTEEKREKKRKIRNNKFLIGFFFKDIFVKKNELTFTLSHFISFLVRESGALFHF